jgi:hypothetical protein
MVERFVGRRRRLGAGTVPLLALLLLVVSSLACGTGGMTTHRNNDVRRAVVAYELTQRGAADELLVSFGFAEVRANLGFVDGNTVWLQPVAEQEYWEYRDPDWSYIFLHRPEVADDTVSVIVDRGDGAIEQSHRLTLRKEDGIWQVEEDVPLTPEAS